MMNKSETSATRRLLQCTGFGLYMNDISSKFAPPATRAPDLPPDAFAARRTVVDQVAHWCETNKSDSSVEWVPIMYLYELVKGSAKRAFLIVMIMPEPCDCGNYSHHDYDAMTKYQADRMMSLLTYLHEAWDWGNKPNWVRATYTTPNRSFKIDPAVLPGVNKSVTPSKGAPPIFHVTQESFSPTLLEGEIEKIDNVCTQGQETRAGPAVVEAARKRVLGSKEDRPDVGDA
ncbi:hypothetical protein EVJ58_g1850 [Rhodofomes roseus]|uniref:Uncharacterized protein n=1 Tax=Rhodofomes roseus TaxID=34475 RepID=A0A4Y9YX07_9APHY|nr:hypothetical protein EVJ58_g1850 [Rhodofomes roseus]